MTSPDSTFFNEHSKSALTRSLPPLVGSWTFVGDVHGKLYCLPSPGHPVVQVGDLGIGFIPPSEDAERIASRDDLWFIRGNHDNPTLCREHPRYLGDWGGHEFMFWLSGARSFDRNFRTEGLDWWGDEEPSCANGGKALEDYIEAKPRLMVSHDGPASLFVDDGPMELYSFTPSSTASLLQAMFEAHQPEVWIFGHHHESTESVIGSTRFRCLAEGETLTLTFGENGAITWPASDLRVPK